MHESSIQVCLFFACAHNVSYGWPYLFFGSTCSIPSSFQYVMYLPTLAAALKLPLLCLGSHLERIRGGYERGKKKGTTMYPEMA